MRTVFTPLRDEIASHAQLAYATLAPIETDGKVPDTKRTQWLSSIAGKVTVDNDYQASYGRWKSSFDEKSGDRCFELELSTRLLLGQGNVSGTDVGLTMHHTWGVPVIPGSALKGLVAHYVDAVYGPTNTELHPSEQPETERLPWQGVTWRGGNIVRGPGNFFRKIFGAPDAEETSNEIEYGFSNEACKGEIVFHDALFVPRIGMTTPYVIDVLTVHQKTYYDNEGKSWPNDYDDPNPVSFLTVAPGARFTFALSGRDQELVSVTETLLKSALEEWGIGAKTSSGYGRLSRTSSHSSSSASAQRSSQGHKSDEATKLNHSASASAMQKALTGETKTTPKETRSKETVTLKTPIKNKSAKVETHDGFAITCTNINIGWNPPGVGDTVKAEVLRLDNVPQSAKYASLK
ncbi:MAG: type III-B CRISPR module RAMP protein Cmr6 [Candidatus Obscuribacterales bacterium]|nr:type III-B CRISPR module RAMP protein Cmr6 [Candidatus Obscuribacterales bacterium]